MSTLRLATDEWARTSTAFNESLRKQTDFFARIAEAITFELPTIDIPGLLAALDRWLPVNLRTGCRPRHRGDGRARRGDPAQLGAADRDRHLAHRG